MQYLSTKQLGEKLGGRSANSIYLDVANGNLPKPLKLGNRNLWVDQEVDDHLAKQREADH